MSTIDFSQLTIGDTVVEAEIPLSRASLVDYAAASGDHNPIHWSERFATEVGLEGVIAHGMLSMAVVIAPIVEWLGDPGSVVDYRTRFSAPVLVPDAESGTPATPTASLALSATVGAVDAALGTARIDVTVKSGETDVLSRTQVRVSR
ncbi:MULTISPECIES: MaoC/PaaZ C-terminal domain-containing protein [unclassified Brevibacterium]|uniref:MaoC/PaaZ C-terminal domain-containing protein n=1 Tax=unclassified Brevibacterium TaxID=2614124 RepID=UPI001E5D0F74|nr:MULTISPECIES: MaoC/PaaZ C-terminal domain-containing protein [unclassified Brevibacterium]MCD1287008.1 acyl dehydratase [Brevibacterium sp. CCUG 69071]MDK8436237.1 MaoC/PaaZ C-terminal domain-containing protein [Brevibacterium sp. H-BE7]